MRSGRIFLVVPLTAYRKGKTSVEELRWFMLTRQVMASDRGCLNAFACRSACECNAASADAWASPGAGLNRPGRCPAFGLGDDASREDHVDDPAMDIGQPVISALESIGQTLAVDTHQVQDRGVKVTDRYRVFRDVEGIVVDVAMRDARFGARKSTVMAKFAF